MLVMFTYEEHTADILIVAEGKSQEEAALYALEGLIGLMERGKKPEETLAFEGKGEDDLERAVCLLNSLIAIVDSEQLRPVRVKKVEGWKAEVEFERGPCRNQAKAATFHMGSAGIEGGKYRIRVVVDI
ncbi:MAG: archease [Candidatus Anstonellales archaeon]